MGPLTLINDILDFSKVDTGKLEMQGIDFALEAQLGDFAEVIAIGTQNKDLELLLDTEPLDRCWAKGDPGRLRQILTNLIGNTLKFTSQGQIEVRAELHPSAPEGLRLTTAVSDSVIDLPPKALGTVFEPFTYIDASTTRQYGSTGLGLGLGKNLCGLRGGALHATSQPGAGSCFEFHIPLVISQQSDTAPRTYQILTCGSSTTTPAPITLSASSGSTGELRMR